MNQQEIEWRAEFERIGEQQVYAKCPKVPLPDSCIAASSREFSTNFAEPIQLNVVTRAAYCSRPAPARS